MPRRIDHLVICVHDLARAEQNLRALGFTLTPAGVHVPISRGGASRYIIAWFHP